MRSLSVSYVLKAITESHENEKSNILDRIFVCDLEKVNLESAIRLEFVVLRHTKVETLLEGNCVCVLMEDVDADYFMHMEDY